MSQAYIQPREPPPPQKKKTDNSASGCSGPQHGVIRPAPAEPDDHLALPVAASRQPRRARPALSAHAWCKPWAGEEARGGKQRSNAWKNSRRRAACAKIFACPVQGWWRATTAHNAMRPQGQMIQRLLAGKTNPSSANSPCAQIASKKKDSQLLHSLTPQDPCLPRQFDLLVIVIVHTRCMLSLSCNGCRLKFMMPLCLPVPFRGV